VHAKLTWELGELGGIRMGAFRCVLGFLGRAELHTVIWKERDKNAEN